MAVEKEGVVRFDCEWISGPPPALETVGGLIVAWRILRTRQWIGTDAEGIGYGNLSQRVTLGSDEFWITGTQTSCLPEIQCEHFTRVTACDFRRNFVRCVGRVAASSETMTHSAVYAALPQVCTVLHVHAAELWHAWIDRKATTPSSAAYGTATIAEAVNELCRADVGSENGIIVMGGHPDGLLIYGLTPEQAVQLLITSANDTKP